MRFAFSEDQLLIQQTLAEMLEKECSHEAVEAAAKSASGRVPGLWQQLVAMGIPAVALPEAQGGLGGDELDLVLLLQEAGRRALPEPLAETAAVAAPLLRELGGELAAEWLPRIAEGAVVVVGLASEPFVGFADGAELLILERGGELFALAPSAVKCEAQRSVDDARRIARVEWSASPAARIASGERAAALAAAAFERSALAAAAQLVGLGRYMVDLTVAYAKGREQFGQAIGAFQAVKHQIASAHLKLEFARAIVQHAAYTLAKGWDSRQLDVSTAKALAGDAAHLCGRAALQCHGAIGYTYEYHLHLWLKRAWALEKAFGDAPWHRRRAAALLLDGRAPSEAAPQAPARDPARLRGRRAP